MSTKSGPPNAAFGDLVHVKTRGDDVRVMLPGSKTRLTTTGRNVPWSIEMERHRLSGAVIVTEIKKPKGSKQEG